MEVYMQESDAVYQLSWAQNIIHCLNRISGKKKILFITSPNVTHQSVLWFYDTFYDQLDKP